MLCKSTAGLPPNPYEVDFKNRSLVCMHVRLCPWIVCRGTIMFADLVFLLPHVCGFQGLNSGHHSKHLLVFLPHPTLSRQGLGFFFFFSCLFQGQYLCVNLKKITILHCRTKKMSPTIFLIYIYIFFHGKKKGLSEVTEMSTFCKISGTLRKYCVLNREQNSRKTELLDHGKYNSYGNEKAILIRGPSP